MCISTRSKGLQMDECTERWPYVPAVYVDMCVGMWVGTCGGMCVGMYVDMWPAGHLPDL